MTEFNLNKYATQRDLYDEPSLETEPEYNPILFGERYLKYSVKHWCDNLDNIIRDESMI